MKIKIKEEPRELQLSITSLNIKNMIWKKLLCKAPSAEWLSERIHKLFRIINRCNHFVKYLRDQSLYRQAMSEVVFHSSPGIKWNKLNGTSVIHPMCQTHFFSSGNLTSQWWTLIWSQKAASVLEQSFLQLFRSLRIEFFNARSGRIIQKQLTKQ